MPAAPRSRDAVLWVIAVLLGMIATALWLRPGDGLPAAWAQGQPTAGARGVFALPGQIDRSEWGLYMVDVDQGTLWCYGIENASGAQRLRLLAARSFVYDRYLQDYNGIGLSFREVQELVARQRNAAAGAAPADTRPGEPNVEGEPHDR